MPTIRFVGPLFLLLSASAQAATLTTPVVTTSDNGGIQCRVLNTAPGPISVTSVRIISIVGTQLDGATNQVISPGQALAIDFTVPSNGSDSQQHQAYCQVTGSFSKSKTLVSLCVTEPASPICLGTVVAPK